MNNEPTIYLNGRFLPLSNARVSLFDAGLVWGAMLFETTRSFGHRPFKLREHLGRLHASMAVTGIECGMSIDALEDVTHELIRRNEAHYPADVDFSIVHNISPGPSLAYAEHTPEAGSPTVAIHMSSLAASMGALANSFDSGVRAYIPRQPTIPARFLDPKVKSRSRLHYWLASNEAERQDPGSWAVLTDDEGYLTEGSGSNFFVVRDGVLLTPEPRHILRGVTRETVLEIAEALGTPWRETNLEPYDVSVADEAFFASTPYVIMPATTFNGHPVGNGAVGPITTQLLDEFSRSVGIDIVAQARAYGPQEP